MTTAKLHDLASFAVDPTSVQLLGDGFCRRKQIVVLGEVGLEESGPVTIGMVDPDDAALLKTLRGYLRRDLAPVRLSKADVDKALDIGHGRWEAPDGEAVLELRPAAGIDIPATADDPLQAALVDLLRRAIARGATAVHVVPGPEAVQARARVGGVLQPLPSPLTPSTAGAFVSRWKGLAALDVGSSATPQRGRVELQVADATGARTLLLHVATLPGPHGEDLTVRIEGGTLVPIGLGELGLLAPQLEALREALVHNEGLVVFCGPPGSGRTSTLYACLQELQPDARKVLSVEDPIAAALPSIGQRALGLAGDLKAHIEAFVDHDADVVAVDPLRGPGAVPALVELGAAQQLLLVTRTATGPAGALQLMVADDAPAAWVADATALVVHQRLARRACPHCATDRAPDAFSAAVAQRLGRTLPLRTCIGCEHCHGTGRKGRLGLFEVLRVDAATAPLVASQHSAAAIRSAARGSGMLSIFDCGIAAIEAGATTLDEVQRVVPSRIVAEWLARA